MDATRQAQTTKRELLAVNRVPDGQPAWLSYRQYRELQTLFDSLSAHLTSDTQSAIALGRLHRFLTDVAHIDAPDNDQAVQFNAFVLLRRGYKIEDITTQEYEALANLMEHAEEPDANDMALHDTGTHRAIYDFLTQDLGVFVEHGRGPVWHRARQLVKHYEE